MNDNNAIFTVNKKLKQSRQNKTLAPVEFKRYDNEDLCVIATLKEYLQRTKTLRCGHSSLFLAYLKPHKPVTASTIGRWVKFVMNEAGINTNIFKPHSTRAASTSAALKANVNLAHILKTAGWSNASTFAKFYNKPVLEDSLAEAILE